MKKIASSGHAAQRGHFHSSTEDDGEQAGVDQHRAGHRDAIGRGEVARILEEQDQQDDHHHQRPVVDHRDVDLPGRRALVCSDPQRGMKPSWIACWVTEKAPEITAWLAMIVASVARMTSGSRNHSGASRKKGLLDGRGVVDQQASPCPI
jgi:hypothetical protein